jgi:hypothetical protein
MAHGQVVFGGIFAGQGNDRCHLLGGELAARAAAVLVREQLEDQFLQLAGSRPLRHRLGQAVLLVDPSSAPTTNALRVDFKLCRLLRAQPSARRHQDDADPLGEVLAQRPGPFESLKYLTDKRVQNNRRCPTRHARLLVPSTSEILILPFVNRHISQAQTRPVTVTVTVTVTVHGPRSTVHGPRSTGRHRHGVVRVVA